MKAIAGEVLAGLPAALRPEEPAALARKALGDELVTEFVAKLGERLRQPA